jgi:hypothetical protein
VQRHNGSRKEGKKMKRTISVVTMVIIVLAAFAACDNDVTLETPVQDKSTGKWGYANKNGRVVLAGKYDLAEVFRGDPALAKVYVGTLRHGMQGEGKWGLIDRTGNEIVPCKYSRIFAFQEGMAEVYTGELYNGSPMDGKFGFIDDAGVEIVPLKYDNVQHGFSEGLAAVNTGGKYEFIRGINRHAFRGGKWGYIDRTGKEVIPLEYVKAGKFSEGKAMVAISENGITKEGYIDKTGKFIAPPIEHTFISYAGKADVENGQTLVLTFTLETKGEQKSIEGYKISIGRGNMLSYDEQSHSSITIKPDGTFSSSSGGFSGTVESGKIDCVFTRNKSQNYTLSAYPQQSK